MSAPPDPVLQIAPVLPIDPVLIAADPARSVWVAANAGAGKTYALAARVTRLLLAGAKPEKILCLTYTKAAAAEMAGRLFDQLGQWAMLPDEPLRARIAAIGGVATGTDDLRRARRLFAAALETPGGLKIQTIHSFCQAVLMRFPLEAGVPASFTVLDERSGQTLMAEARARVFERAGRGDAPRAAAIATLVAQLSDDRIAHLLDVGLGPDRGRIAAFLDRCTDERARTAALKAAHGAGPDDDEKTVYGDFSARFEAEAAHWRDAAAWLAGGAKTDGQRADRLQQAVEAAMPADRFAAVRDALLTRKGEIRSKLATKKLADARPDLVDFLGDEARRLLADADRLKALAAAALSAATLSLIAAVRDVYADEKRAIGALDYDDLIAKTHALLQNGGAQWVLYKLDEGIDHVLIDEAQDTSAPQWDIVQALTEEFFAGDARPALRTLFAVGDEKQSIFSFQGADPVQFARRRRFFAQRAREAGCAFSAVDLPVSRRSAPEILSFVDTVFADEAARAGLTSEGGPVRHEPFRTEAKGMVEFWPAETPADRPKPDVWNLRPLDLAAEDAPISRLSERIADEIAGWLARGAALPGKTVPIDPGDIMILLPRREPFAGEIIRKLKKRGVPVAGADRLRLGEQIAVMDLVALGRFALLPEDDLNLAALLRSPLIGLSEEDLFSLAHGRKTGLWRALSERRDAPALAGAHAFLSAARARADQTPPFEFYARTLNETRRAMLKRLGSESADAIEEFLSLTLAYERTATPSLQGFLHWFEMGGAEVKRDMDRARGEVRVMTVHGSKGLEADIVILPDTTTLPDKRTVADRFLYTDDVPLFPLADDKAPHAVVAAKEAALAEIHKERRRLLYVALTRARERLYVCGFENGRGTAEGSWYRLTEAAAKTLGRAQADALVYGTAETVPADTPPAPPPPPAPPIWATTPAPDEAPAPRMIRPSQAAGSDEPPAKPPFSARKAGLDRGMLVHALLARLPEIAPAERDAAARRYLAARGLEAAAAETLAASVEAVLKAPEFAAVFAPGSRAEVALAADLPELGPGARVHGRIDRLAIQDDAVILVDFKSNRAVPADPAAVPGFYVAQMALYRLALRKIFPDKRIVCGLIWTEGPKLMPLADHFLEAETNRIRSRLTKAGAVLK